MWAKPQMRSGSYTGWIKWIFMNSGHKVFSRLLSRFYGRKMLFWPNSKMFSFQETLLLPKYFLHKHQKILPRGAELVLEKWLPTDLPRKRCQYIYKELKSCPPRNPIPLSEWVNLRMVQYAQTKTKDRMALEKGQDRTRKMTFQMG